MPEPISIERTATSLFIAVSHNGQEQQLPQNTDLASAINAWGYGEKKIAAAINGDFITRANYHHTQLKQGDKIDIVSPVGGG